MKKILFLLFLYIILGFIKSQSSNIIGNSTKLLIRRNKNLMKSHDKMIIKRYLEENEIDSGSDSDDEFESSSEETFSEESYSEESFEPTPITPNRTAPIVGDPNADIYLIDINNFNKPRGNNNATFNIFFYYIRRPVMKFIFFALKVIYSRLRNLDEMERIAICQLENSDYANKETDKIVKYKCETNETINVDSITIKSDNDFKSGDTEDISKATSITGLTFNKKIEEDLDNIQSKTNPEFKNYFILKEGIYDDFTNNRFTIKGIMDDLDINDKNVNFTLYHNGDEERTVLCSVIKNQTKDYQLRCNAQNRTSASLVSVNGITDQGNAISLNMKEGYDNINTGTNLKNKMYQKSGSGLSGGGIAGVVIACVVALVIASIIAIMLRKPKPQIQNMSSVIQANSVDNLNG